LLAQFCEQNFVTVVFATNPLLQKLQILGMVMLLLNLYQFVSCCIMM